MATDLAVIEPFQLPDLRRPGRLPSLPGWLVAQLAAASSNLQIDQKTGRFREVLTLPADRMPNDAQREAATNYCRQLREACERTPENGDDWEKAMMAVLTKMFLALPSRRDSVTSAEVKVDVYMEALDDVPTWAVAEALRGWYRGTHPAETVNGRSVTHDFGWSPAPATLRRLALFEAFKFEARAREIEKVLTIQPFDPSADAHCAAMRERLKEVVPWIVREKEGAVE